MNFSDDYKGKKVLVVGLGRSGLGAVRLLHYLGAKVFVTEKRTDIENIFLPKDIIIETGEHTLKSLVNIDTVIVSPGVAQNILLLKKAQEKGIKIESELEFAWKVSRNYPIKWIAITGTNGKSTTTTLISLMFKKQGHKVITGGNIGIAISELILESFLKKTIKDIQYILVEVSSFQLERINEFSPNISVILNITPDHLDRHKTMQDYIKIKSKIFMNQKNNDILILNYDDFLLKNFGDNYNGILYYFSRKYELQRGGFIKHGWIVLRLREKNEIVPIISSNELKIKGVHNLENALAASLTAFICGVSAFNIKEVLKDFKGLPHRMEFVDDIEGVKFYNDSKGTNIGAVLRSVESVESPVILILGGKNKGGDFSVLNKFSNEKIKTIITFGEASENLKKQLCKYFKIENVKDMKEAVWKAFEIAVPDDVVLLSPGCASFDMFQDYQHRGEVFKNIVKELKKYIISSKNVYRNRN